MILITRYNYISSTFRFSKNYIMNTKNGINFSALQRFIITIGFVTYCVTCSAFDVAAMFLIGIFSLYTLYYIFGVVFPDVEIYVKECFSEKIVAIVLIWMVYMTISLLIAFSITSMLFY